MASKFFFFKRLNYSWGIITGMNKKYISMYCYHHVLPWRVNFFRSLEKKNWTQYHSIYDSIELEHIHGMDKKTQLSQGCRRYLHSGAMQRCKEGSWFHQMQKRQRAYKMLNRVRMNSVIGVHDDIYQKRKCWQRLLRDHNHVASSSLSKLPLLNPSPDNSRDLLRVF